MTKQEQIIVSAYTGYLIADNFDEVQDYIQQKLGRPVFTHELADPRVLEEIRDKVRPDLLSICD